MRTTSATGNNAGLWRATAAFTLIELSVVVFILALLVAVAVPSFVRSYNNLQLDEAARAFATTCQLARIQAVSQQRPATLHISVERQNYWLSQPWAEAGQEPQEIVLKQVALPARVTLVQFDRDPAEAVSTNEAEAASIQFLPNGTCEGGTVVFRGSEKGQVLAATVDPITGKARVGPVKL